MEGPSIVIATEELAKFNKRKPLLVEALSLPLKEQLSGKTFLKAESWGKHLLLHFRGLKLRIHFLMFGSYRINNPRAERTPKLKLTFKSGTVYFYSCAIKVLSPGEYEAYDREIDLMSPQWNPARALKELKKSEGYLCDVLMDQKVFAGLGNIMKNEILFRQKLHPEVKVNELSLNEKRKVIKASHNYAWQFYQWKKDNVLKRNWLIFRKKKCPVCGRAVKKEATGEGQRISHYCTYCQRK